MRKFTLLFISFSILTATLNAQITKGSILLGGGVSGYYHDASLSDNKNYGFNISPVYGKAIKENLVVGGGLSFGLADNSNEDIDQLSAGASVFLRKYKPIGKSGFYLFGQADLGVNMAFQDYGETTTSGIDERRITTIGASLNPGVAYAITRRFHLELGLGSLLYINYSHEKSEFRDPSIQDDSGFSLNMGTSFVSSQNPVFVGFRFFLAK